MQSAGDWGKPIKKNTSSAKEQAPPKETANTTGNSLNLIPSKHSKKYDCTK